jgi:hypothetical protein
MPKAEKVGFCQRIAPGKIEAKNNMVKEDRRGHYI